MTLTIRLTEDERLNIIKKAYESGLNVTAYLIKVSDEAVIVPPVDLKPVLLEMKKIGANINQIAMKMNSGVVGDFQFETIVESQKLILNMLTSIAEGNTWQQ